jgi:hypothetical protein
MITGAHPSYVFRTVTADHNGTPVKINRADRYAAIDIAPSYFFSKYSSIGFYYLYSHGLDKTSVQNTHFITLNANFTHINLPGKFYAKFNPQVYYLNQSGQAGFYFTQSLTLAHARFPISIQTIMNKAIHTNITGNDFVWNASLIYQFNKNYVLHK